MTFDDVLRDIQRLSGHRLSSIAAAADITVIGVDRSTDRLELRTATGQIKTRPLEEIKRIWEEMARLPAVHVDSFLGGSGSSRNQPETILANLPYVEWLYIDRKKHIALVKRSTHALGTLRQMDPVQAQETKDRLRAAQETGSSERTLVLVTAVDLPVTSQLLEHVIGTPARPVSPGVYEFSASSTTVLLVSTGVVPSNMDPGTYPVLANGQVPQESPVIELAGMAFVIVANREVRFAVRV